LTLFFKELYKYKKLFLYGKISGFVTPTKKNPWLNSGGQLVYSHVLLYRFVCVKTCAVTNKSKRLFPTVEPRVTLVAA